jgi:drug/metabolite transporter (DMT)-like permease
MPLLVMIVVLLAALLHASWNFLVKSTEDKALSMSAMVVGHLPFSLVACLLSPLPEVKALPYLLGGVALHLGYQLFLLASYRSGDLSQVYPLARGSSPLIVAAVSVFLLGVRLSRIELTAVAVIGIGIMSLTLVRRSDGLRNGRAASLAIITGGFIASYSLMDGLGAREAGTALGFYGWLSMVNGIIFALIMRVFKAGTVTRLVGRDWRLALRVGGASFSAYAMVIWAFTMAPIPLVTALRETSIIFALLLGVFVLKERLDLMKVFATACTLLGVGLLRINR